MNKQPYRNHSTKVLFQNLEKLDRKCSVRLHSARVPAVVQSVSDSVADQPTVFTRRLTPVEKCPLIYTKTMLTPKLLPTGFQSLLDNARKLILISDNEGVFTIKLMSDEAHFHLN